jgi:hypothetical protein
MGMKRSNKLKVPPAVRQAARQAAKAQEIKGLGKPKLQVTDGVSAAKMREQFREQKRTKWLWQEGDMVRFRDYQTGTNQMGMVVSVDTQYETLTVTSPIGLRTLNCREAKLMDRLDNPCDEPSE